MVQQQGANQRDYGPRHCNFRFYARRPRDAGYLAEGDSEIEKFRKKVFYNFFL
jgi:hypothetical protein